VKFPSLHFDWPSPHNIHVALPLMLAVSAALHIAGIVVFQVSGRRPESSPQRPAHVIVVPPASPEAALIAPMLAAADPSLFSPVSGDSVPAPIATYIASYASGAPALDPLPAAPALTLAVTPLVTRSMASRPPARPASKGLATQVRFGGNLAGRSFAPGKSADFSAPPRQGLRPARFVAAVDSGGRIIYAFLEISSGVASLDRAAFDYLKRGRLEPVGSPGAWGTIDILWDTDVSRPSEP